MNDRKPAFFAVDFFCGAGGTTRGLIDAGGYVVAGVDKVEQCRETYEHNNINQTLDRSPARYLMRDVFEKSEAYPDGEMRELTSELNEMLSPLMAAHPDVPLLFSICAPCQPFTKITRIEMTEERSTKRVRDRGLLGQSLEYVKTFMPEMILCENVAGIQNPKYGGVWQAFTEDLEELGYVVGSAIVNTVNFGIPQKRRRSIMVAVHKNAAVEGEFAQSIAVPLEDPSSAIVTVREAIEDLPPIKAGESHPEVPNHQAANLTEINKRRLEMLKPGEGNKKFIGTELELPCHRKMREKAASGHYVGYSAGFTDVYSRVDPDKPSNAITTKFYATSCGRFGHYSQTRAFSIREGAILQSFPEDYHFLGKTMQDNARMVGNAVPPKLAEYFASWMVERSRAFVTFEARTLREQREAQRLAAANKAIAA